jgi:hypothetical protein
MMIALPNCANLPDWEVDDAPFHRALEALGVAWERPIWDDARIDWSRYDAVLIRTTWDYQEKEPAFVAWASHVATVSKLFNPPEVITWNTKKTYLRDLEEAGARLTPTQWLEVGTTPDIAERMKDVGWQRGFLKPVVGATARETLRFNADPEGLSAAQAHLDRLLPTESMMLQPYLSTVEEAGELSALYFGGEYSHGVRKVPVPGDYRVQDDFGASDEPYAFTEAEEAELSAMRGALTTVLSQRLGVSEPLLYARVDVLRDGHGGLYLNELELVEPSLFFRHDPESPRRLAQAIVSKLSDC